jgi:hypothetical protein
MSVEGAHGLACMIQGSRLPSSDPSRLSPDAPVRPHVISCIMAPRSSNNEILDSEDEDDLVTVRRPSLVHEEIPCPDAVGDASLSGVIAPSPLSGSGAPSLLGVGAPALSEIRATPLVTRGQVMDVESTASTEELLRRAHAALMEPTQDALPIVNFSDLAATSAATSPSSTNKKRPNTDSRTSGKLKRIKVVQKPWTPEHAVPALVLPFDGTNDTIPGPTIPSMTAPDALSENKTPTTRTRNASQQYSPSIDQPSILTPWSVSAVGSSDRLNSDDTAAIGIAKDLYIPRPTRSRSGPVEVPHNDYIMNVERSGTSRKARPKRSATDTVDTPASASIFPKNPVLQAPDFERLSPSPESPDFERSMQLDSAVSESIQDPPSSTKSSKPTKKPAKRGRPKKKVIGDEDDELAQEDEISLAQPKTKKSGKTEVQVIIPTTKSDPALAATILAQLRQHKSREATPKPSQDDEIPPQADDFGHAHASLELEMHDNFEEEQAVKPEPTTKAKGKSKAKPKAKAKSKALPEPVVAPDSSPEADEGIHVEHHDDEHVSEAGEESDQDEDIKPKPKSRVKAKAEPKAKAAPRRKADFSSDEESDHVSEAEEDSEEEEEEEVTKPKPKSKAKPKAKPGPKPKAEGKTKAATPKPDVAPALIAEMPKPVAAAMSPCPAPPPPPPPPSAVATPKSTSAKKEARSSSAKPSWQQSTHRIGLSKHQRIPSLLKVFKR